MNHALPPTPHGRSRRPGDNRPGRPHGTLGSIQVRYTAVYQRTDDWWAGWVEELPAANTQGRTLDEARENLRDAVTVLLEVNRELSRRDMGDGVIVREELLVETD
jgi:predicted RNase H-like HicB family nuclease